MPHSRAPGSDRFSRRGEAVDLFVDGGAGLRPACPSGERRMPRPEFAGQFRVALPRLGILRAQIGDGRGLQRLGNRAVIGRAAAAGVDLVVLAWASSVARVPRQAADCWPRVAGH